MEGFSIGNWKDKACDSHNSQIKGLNDSNGVDNLSSDMLRRCRLLLDELEEFLRYIVEDKKQLVRDDFRSFNNNANIEYRSIEKVCQMSVRSILLWS